MAGAVFNDEGLINALKKHHFVPVLVDGDEERNALGSYSVRGFPTVKFLNSQGREIKDAGYARQANVFIALVEATAKEIGKPKLHKDYVTFVKESAKLEKAMAKKRYKNAIKAIKAIEVVGREGKIPTAAAAEKAKLVEIAQTQMEEAKALIEETPKRARTKLKKISKEFAGLEIAEEAKKLAATLK